MNIPNFHDGFFDGFWLGPNKDVHLFLKTGDKLSYTLVLHSVQALTLSEVKAGNIILDLVFRSAGEMTSSDVAELYGVDANTDQVAKLLKTSVDKGLQILELNPSYGAQGLFLFDTCEIAETSEKASSVKGQVSR
jgi:hypothetical protein